MSKTNSERIHFDIYKNFYSEIGPWEENSGSPFEIDMKFKEKIIKNKSKKQFTNNNSSDTTRKHFSISSLSELKKNSITNEEITSLPNLPKITLPIFPKIKKRLKSDSIKTQIKASFDENLYGINQPKKEKKEFFFVENNKFLKKCKNEKKFISKFKDEKYQERMKIIDDCIKKETKKNEKLKNTIRNMLKKNNEGENLIKIYQKINKNMLKIPIKSDFNQKKSLENKERSIDFDKNLIKDSNVYFNKQKIFNKKQEHENINKQKPEIVKIKCCSLVHILNNK